jgi:predicted RND superfamily exporter protein
MESRTMTLDDFMSSFFNPLTKPIATRLDAIDRRLQGMEADLHRVLGMELGDAKRDHDMAKSLDRLMQEVTENREAVGSIEQLVTGLAQQIRDAAGDEAALERLADELDANTGRLGKVVLDNTEFKPSQS